MSFKDFNLSCIYYLIMSFEAFNLSCFYYLIISFEAFNLSCICYLIMSFILLLDRIVSDSFRSLPIPSESFSIVSDPYRSKYVDYLENFLRVLFVFIF